MKKIYEIPEAEEIRTDLEMGLLTTTGSEKPIEEDDVMPEDSWDD